MDEWTNEWTNEWPLDEGVKFIVDEVQTGCGVTGHFWAHEAWWGRPLSSAFIRFHSLDSRLKRRSTERRILVHVVLHTQPDIVYRVLYDKRVTNA